MAPCSSAVAGPRPTTGETLFVEWRSNSLYPRCGTTRQGVQHLSAKVKTQSVPLNPETGNKPVKTVQWPPTSRPPTDGK
eukprot:4083652-Pyramimonas_sp.AAC.1